MVFGNDSFFNLLKSTMLQDPDNSSYSEILKIVENDVFSRILSKVDYPDCDDVLQQVLVSVWTSLAKFVLTSEDNTPAQRNAWLNRIVDNKISDYFRKQYSIREVSIDEDISVLEGALEHDPYAEIEAKEIERGHQEKLDNALSYIFSLNIAPEKIIAFMYSKVIFFLKHGGSIKGSAQYACEKLNGKSISEIKPIFFEDLQTSLGRKLPPTLLKQLEEKLSVDDLSLEVHLREQTVNDSTRYILKRVRKNDQTAFMR